MEGRARRDVITTGKTERYILVKLQLSELGVISEKFHYKRRCYNLSFFQNTPKLLTSKYLTISGPPRRLPPYS